MNVLDVNTVNMRNAYPTALGNTIGISAGAGNQSGIPSAGVNGATPTAGDSGAVSSAVSIGGQANPVIGAVVFLALIIALAFLAKRFGGEDEFRNVRVSPYNVLIVSLAAIIGIPVWKYAFTRFPLPGVTTWVQSA